jgi:hypothetical protein
MTVNPGITDKDSWISYVKQLPRDRPNDLYLRFTTGDQQINLCEGEEAFIGSYYVRVDRIYRTGMPGELSSMAIARMSAGVSKDMVVKSAEVFLRRCRR